MDINAYERRLVAFHRRIDDEEIEIEGGWVKWENWGGKCVRKNRHEKDNERIAARRMNGREKVQVKRN